MARAQAYAIYENDSGIPLATLGKFDIDPSLLVPMFSSYRSAAKEIFGAGINATQIEGNKWLCFVPGECTTMLALFSNEPSIKQLGFLRELHILFEQANLPNLKQLPVKKERLVFPHEYFLGKWNK